LLLEPADGARASVGGAAGAELELRAEDLDADVYQDDKIDLGCWLREQVLLETPVHPRHPGDCPVPLLLPQASPAGRGAAVDPRLAVLKTLTLKKE
jgi:uncharacterized metal-binding protein YceD (DUF177 family)